MKALAITNSGIEDITALEISSIIKTKTKTYSGCVEFEVQSQEDIALLCYKSQSISKIIYLFDSFKLNSLKDLQESIKKNLNNTLNFITTDKTFAVRCEKQNNSEFERDEICIEAADALKLESKVDLDNPDVIFFVYINDKCCYIGIDFSGEDLSKREYRIYVHQGGLKATIAYALLRIANYNKNDIILDPFCGSATILIEAALYSSNFSQNYYSKDKFAFCKFLEIDLEKYDPIESSKGKIMGFDNELRHVMAAKKNAKIAGIEKSIKFSRIDVENLDLKLAKNTIDKIITNTPNVTNRTNDKKVGKIYDDFFKNADIVLKSNGTITLITKSADLIIKFANKHGFRVDKERELVVGKENYKLIVFDRG